MTQELIPTNDQASFNAMLNEATGMARATPRPMNIRFDAVNGVWMREIDEKDGETGFNKWVEISEELKFHLITTRKQYRSDFNAQEKFYSIEFSGFKFQLLNANKEPIFEGTAKELKAMPELHKAVSFVQVVYAFVDVDGAPILHKVKLSGSNIVSFFPYLSSFGKDESSAAIYTVATKGTRMKSIGGNSPSVPATIIEIEAYTKELQAGRKPKLNLYYEIAFTKGDPIDQATIIQRVKDVNEYLVALQGSRQEAERGEVVSTNVGNTKLMGKDASNVDFGDTDEVVIPAGPVF
jgi:hypothetical protein